MKLAFFKTGELQGILKHINALLEYLKGKGIELKVLNLEPENVQKTVDELQEFKPSFVLDINATGIIVGENEGEKKALCDILGYVHLSLFTDDPLLHFPHIHGISPRNMIGIVTDIKHADSLKMLGVDNVSYITPFLDFSLFPQPQSERDIDIAFLGPVIDPQIVVNAVQKNIPENIFPIFIETGEYMFRNPEVNVLTALSYVLGIFNPQFQQEFNNWRQKEEFAFFRLLNDIAIYATMRKRWYLINFLEGVNLKIIGDFQGELKEDHENIPVNSYEDFYKIYGRTCITVMSFPYTVPTSTGFVPLEVAAMGSAGMVDFRGTLTSFFKPGEEIIPYLPLDRADIEEKVLYYLDNLEEAKEIGERAKQAVIDRFRVNDRGDFIIKIMGEILSQSQQQSSLESPKEN